MNSEAWAGVAAGAAAGVKAVDQAEVPAGGWTEAEVDSHNKTTEQPFYQLTIPKGGEQYAAGR